MVGLLALRHGCRKDNNLENLINLEVDVELSMNSSALWEQRKS